MSEKKATNPAVVAQIDRVWEAAKVAGVAMKSLPDDFPTNCVRDVLVELQAEVYKLMHATHVSPIPAEVEQALMHYSIGVDSKLALDARKRLRAWIAQVEQPYPANVKDNLTEAFHLLISGSWGSGTLKHNPSAMAVPVMSLNHWWVSVMTPILKEWQDWITEYEALKAWLRDNDILMPESEGSFEFAMKKYVKDPGVDIIAELDDILVPENSPQVKPSGLPNIQVHRWDVDLYGNKGLVAINIAKAFKNTWLPFAHIPPVFKHGSPFVLNYTHDDPNTGKIVASFVQFNAIPGYKPEPKLDVTDLTVNTFGSTDQTWGMKVNGVMVTHEPSKTVAMCDQHTYAAHQNKAVAFESLQRALEHIYGIT